MLSNVHFQNFGKWIKNSQTLIFTLFRIPERLAPKGCCIHGTCTFNRPRSKQSNSCLCLSSLFCVFDTFLDFCVDASELIFVWTSNPLLSRPNLQGNENFQKYDACLLIRSAKYF